MPGISAIRKNLQKARQKAGVTLKMQKVTYSYGNKYNPYVIDINKKGGRNMADATLSKPIPADMEVTPERALKIKQALIRQYEDQFGVEVISWVEKKREETPAPA